MASEADLDDARDTLDRAEPGSCVRQPGQRRALWRLLAAYRMSDDYAGFCGVLGLDPGSPEAVGLYDAAHACWVAAWDRYGWSELHRLCNIGWRGLYDSYWRLT